MCHPSNATKWALILFCAFLVLARGRAGGSAVAADLQPSSGDSAETLHATVGWRLLLDQAEPIYAAGNYKDVLPLYVRAVQAANLPVVAAKDRIQCLRYLADCYCRLDQPDEAMAQYQRIESLLATDDVENRVINLNHQALCFGLRADYTRGEALCRAALKLCGDGKPEYLWQFARTQAQLAYFDYMRAKYALAAVGFQRAEKALDGTGRSDFLATVFRQKMAFAQAGSYYHLRRFGEAYQQFKRVYELSVLLLGKIDLQTGWAMLAMSDVLAKLGQIEPAEDWYRKAIYVFRKFNRDRLCKEFACRAAPGVDLQQRINDYVFGNSKVPSDLENTQAPLCKDSSDLMNTHDPRSLYARPFTDAPGRVWLNPLVQQQGIVIAIHGLSLQHSSYDAFARQLADSGFSTVAFDMRGFGSYRQALGAEQLDFDGCMRDLELVVKAIKTDHPGMPLFMLGESMGGAIALQFAAQHPQMVDGLIASVPAGRRFQQRRTAVKVAVHYLTGKNRPFDIGTDVINRATTDPELQQAWAADPNTRSRLSPRELLAFQSMLNRNLGYAKRIRSTPVVIFQGVSDELVRPEATYDLFRAIATKDKSFIMVGNAEHLIFEEGCFTPAVVKGLVAWMESHGKLAAS